jgi:hypothetical protein
LQTCFEEHLTDMHLAFMHLLRVAENFLPVYIRPRKTMGRPIIHEYHSFIRSAIGKIFFQITTNKGFIQGLKSDPNLRQICGFKKVPGEADFSRMFTFFAEEKAFNPALDDLVKSAHSGKIVFHSNRDSTMIAARERAPKKAEKVRKPKKKRGRPPKDTKKVPREPTELEKQVIEDTSVSLEKVNKDCSWGCKKNSQGKIEITKGYKLHLDVSDTGFPLTAIVTGANVHDSQLAIPMEKLTEQKVNFCYSLMDAAYDANAINNFIISRGRIPIIDPNNRGNENRPPLDPAKKERYKIRTAVERANSHLKDNLIPKSIYVKGHTKVSFALMASVFCLASIKYLQQLIC